MEVDKGILPLFEAVGMRLNMGDKGGSSDNWRIYVTLGCRVRGKECTYVSNKVTRVTDKFIVV